MESVSQVQFSGSCSQEPGSQSSSFQFPGTYFQRPRCQRTMSQSLSSRVLGARVPCSSVPESQDPGSQSPRSQGVRIPGLRVLGPRVSGLRVPGPGSQVLILDYAVFSNDLYKSIHLRSFRKIIFKVGTCLSLSLVLETFNSDMP